MLFDAFLLEKAVGNLGYALLKHPEEAHIPLQGVLQVLEGEELEDIDSRSRNANR